jgi:putative acyl-CoA dehydrogenase
MTLMIEAGVHAAPWLAPGPGAQVARAAAFFLFGQVENGAQCPVTMTYASVPPLAAPGAMAPGLAERWLPKILARQYDPRPLPIDQKRGALIGMGMTEKQGGTDVRANTTCATPWPVADNGALAAAGAWRIVGHKWFFSAPQADAHLVLAQVEEEEGGRSGLTCFLVPRFLDDGSHNAVRIQRLKDKVGNRSNASSEVEFAGAVGYPVGQPGRGIPTILEMVGHTRLDCVVGSAAIMRAALTHALHHARGRQVFGRPLAQQSLMQNVLADLALESEGATALALRLARCFERGADGAADQHDALLARVLTPAAKYWICKRGPAVCVEAMEVMGGNGYVEEGPLARLFREAPVNSIWEGSGNVMCLDVLRALARSGESRAALGDELALAWETGGAAAAAAAPYKAYCLALLDELGTGAAPVEGEYGARRLAERIVLAVQAGLLLRHAPAFVSTAFVASRLAQAPGGAFGCLPAGVDCEAILARALPQPA